MSRRPHGKATVDPNYPQAFAVCDRCGDWHNHVDLSYQFVIAGQAYINSRMLVCQRCHDEPALFLRPLILPPDPVPIRDPRVESFAADEIDYLTANGDHLITEDGGDNIVTNDASVNFSETSS